MWTLLIEFGYYGNLFNANNDAHNSKRNDISNLLKSFMRLLVSAEEVFSTFYCVQCCKIIAHVLSLKLNRSAHIQCKYQR